MRTYVEDFPCLDIGDLGRLGAFSDAAGSAVSVPVKNGAVTVKYDPSSGRLKVGTGRKQQSVAVLGTQLKFGVRRFFVCPEEFWRTSKLYLKGGKWASRQAHDLKHLSTSGRKRDKERATAERLERRLLGTTTKGPARGANRDAIVEELSDPALLRQLSPETKRKVLREQNRAVLRKARERTNSDLTFSTAVAIANGQREPIRWPREKILKRLALMSGFDLDLALNRAIFDLNKPAPVMAIEQPDTYPRLDIRVLSSSGLLAPGKLTTAHLAWDTGWTRSLADIVLIIDWRRSKPTLTVIGRDVYEKCDVRQDIDLELVDNQLFMVCPLSHKRRLARILYLREGKFGSKEEQRLKNNPTAAEIAFPR